MSKTPRKRRRKIPGLPPCGHLPELEERTHIFNQAYYSGLNQGTVVGLKIGIEALSLRVTEATDRLALTPRGDPKRKQTEDLVLERLAALHAVSRDSRGNLRSELAGAIVPREA